MAAKYPGCALIYGGNGALGSGCVNHFKSNNWWVISVDLCEIPHDELQTAHTFQQDDAQESRFKTNKEADVNILMHVDKSLTDQESEIKDVLKGALGSQLLDVIICVAGGFITGNTRDGLIESTERMLRQNLWPSLISASLAASFLAEDGLLCLTGANAALEGTPETIGYGLSKAAVHQLIKSLGSGKSGLPRGSLCVGLLPVTLDTVVNRHSMPDADISGWTPTKYIVDLLYKWSLGKERPKNGSLVRFVTRNFNTDVSYL